MNTTKIRVNSKNVRYCSGNIFSLYSYHKNDVFEEQGSIEIAPRKIKYIFKTSTYIPKTGVMLVGLGGNNGSTVLGGILANKFDLKWTTKDGEMSPNYFGSITQAATLKIGDANCAERFVPFGKLLPMVSPNDLVVSGWDINSDDLKRAMAKSKVFDYALQKELGPLMEKVHPLPSIYYKDFIAANQLDRANNCLPGDRASHAHLEALRQNIRDFKAANGLDKVIVLWTANTERFCSVTEGVHDTEQNLMKAIQAGHAEIAPSQMFALAAILEDCAYINGSPQNTFVPAIQQAAESRGVFIAGDDFKSGQTKMKSVLVDFLVSAGIRPESIVSYNHLGNNDGKNLSSPRQFTSKEISKSNVVDDMVASNTCLYSQGQKPDHCVVIKYVPFVGDSKRAMDEYVSSIFMNGLSTIVMHNTCEDSLLAAPIIIDLVLLTELFQRVEYHCPALCAIEKRANGVQPENVGARHKRKRAKLDDEQGGAISEETKDIIKGGEGNGRRGDEGNCSGQNGPRRGEHGTREGVEKGTESEQSLESLFAREADLGAALSFSKMHSVLSALSYLMKSPLVRKGTPVVNSLFRQRLCIENIFRACLGLQPESNMLLEHKCGAL